MIISHLIREENMPLRHLCVIEDITQRKLMDVRMNLLSQSIEQSPTSIIITDTNSIIEYVNPKFVERTGYSLHDVLGNNSRMLIAEETADLYEEFLETVNSGKTWVGEFQNVKKDKTLYWESAIISPIKDKNNNTTHFLAISEDITERKMMEEKLQKIAWKQSHEIRGPLATLMGIVTVMNYDITLDEKLALLGKLDEAANILDAVIHSIVHETKTKQ
jgi:PAS domain S-box-containing protein